MKKNKKLQKFQTHDKKVRDKKSQEWNQEAQWNGLVDFNKI